MYKPNFTYDQTHHAHIKEAFEKQCEIGWDEFLRGRISSRWGNIMQTYYRTMNLGSFRNGMAWEVKVIHTMWQIFLQTWQARNNLLHGADTTENRQIRSLDIDQQVRNAYRLDQNCIAPQHQGLFTNLHDTLNNLLDTKIQWLHSIRSAKSAWINLLHQEAPNNTDVHNVPPPP